MSAIFVVILLLLETFTSPASFVTGIKTQPTRRNDVIFGPKGDINFGFMSLAHFSSDNIGSCDEWSPTACTSELEPFRFAIDAINSRTDILPNLTVGYVALDTCGTPVHSLEMSCMLIGSAVEGSLDVAANVSDYDVIGVVGPLNSGTSSEASSFLGIFDIPMIATYATSDTLACDNDTNDCYYDIRVKVTLSQYCSC